MSIKQRAAAIALNERRRKRLDERRGEEGADHLEPRRGRRVMHVTRPVSHSSVRSKGGPVLYAIGGRVGRLPLGSIEAVQLGMSRLSALCSWR